MVRSPAGARALLTAAAACNATFWILALIIGSPVGVDAVRHPLWIASHLLHVLGALLVIPAIPVLISAARQPHGSLAPWSGALAMIGAALFAADGVIALSVLPVLADNDRLMLEPWGAMNAGWMMATYVVLGVVNMIGWVLLAATLWGGRMRTWAVAVLAAGAVLFNLPRGQVPIAVLAVGGLLWSAALLVFSVDLASQITETAPIRRARRS